MDIGTIIFVTIVISQIAMLIHSRGSLLKTVVVGETYGDVPFRRWARVNKKDWRAKSLQKYVVCGDGLTSLGIIDGSVVYVKPDDSYSAGDTVMLLEQGNKHAKIQKVVGITSPYYDWGDRFYKSLMKQFVSTEQEQFYERMARRLKEFVSKKSNSAIGSYSIVITTCDPNKEGEKDYFIHSTSDVVGKIRYSSKN